MERHHVRISSVQGLIVLTCCLLVISTVSSSAYPDHRQKLAENSREGVQKILNYILREDGKHQTYDRLAELGDRFGPRTSGSLELEEAIDYIHDKFKEEHLDNVEKEDLLVPNWTRGQEWATLHVPEYGWTRRMSIMALGTSEGTNNVTLVAEAVVVSSWAELEGLSNETVGGKIVVYNQPWTDYFEGRDFRSLGAMRAAEKGAVAALTRSVTARSIYSPHTGGMTKTSIPGVSITVEDAEMMHRLQKRNLTLIIQLYMEAQNHPDSVSHNLVGEIVGSEFPNETVIIGGHIDTWDVTDGSMDDGGGVMMAWEAVRVIKLLDLKPKRTIRVVLWTAEEFGLTGGREYYRRHNLTSNDTALVMQADLGSFNPYGILLSGGNRTRQVMQEIMDMLGEINATQICPGSGRSSDTGFWVDAGVPGVELCNANEDYFDWHHTWGDAMTVLDRDHLDKCTIIWATVAYAVANLDELLPRGDDVITAPTTPTTPTTPPQGLTAAVMQSTTYLVLIGSVMALWKIRAYGNR